MSTIAVDLREYVRLMVRAGETNPTKWPDGLRDGAGLLSRIHGIEQACRDAHGYWDWELLGEDEQDEYDAACALLDRFIDQHFPEPKQPLSDVVAELCTPLG